MSVEIIVRETKTGLEIISGRRRLDALLAVHDEVVVMSPGVGEVVIARLPDGTLAGIGESGAHCIVPPAGHGVGDRRKASPEDEAAGLRRFLLP